MFTYYFYDVFNVPALIGWLNLVLFVMLVLNYFIKKLGFRNKIFLKIKKFIIKYHKIFAVLLIIFLALHGYLMFGFYLFNSGLVIFIFVVIDAILGTLTFLTKKKTLKIHRLSVILTFIAIMFHVLKHILN